MLNTKLCEDCLDCKIISGGHGESGGYQKKQFFCFGMNAVVTPDTPCPYGYFDAVEELIFYLGSKEAARRFLRAEAARERSRC